MVATNRDLRKDFASLGPDGLAHEIQRLYSLRDDTADANTRAVIQVWIDDAETVQASLKRQTIFKPLYDRDVLDLIKSRIDLVALVEYYGHETRRQGRNYVVQCLSPEHADRHPSCTVYPDPDPHLHCHVCGWHGDAFNVVMELEHVDFLPAVAILAARANVSIEAPAWASNGRPTPRIEPVAENEPAEPADEDEPAEDWKALVAASSLDAAELPYYFERLVTHIKPFTPMFPIDWPVMMMLPFWSSLWPGVRLQNLNMVIWTLGIQLQGVGKNVATDEGERTVRGIATKTGQEIVLYTAGTPEGIWDALSGERKQMLAYLDEFGGYLKLLRRDHMQGARETLCSLYDGRAVGYLRAQKNGVGITDPHFVIAATATPTAIREFVEPQDLTNGFLSRFLVCAPDGTRTAPEYYPDDGQERQELVDELSRHLLRLQRVKTVIWQETGKKDPPRLNAYREHLGMGSGEVIDLDDHMAQETIPAGRLVARAKKIAALLELAEAAPNLNEADSSIIEIRPENLETAIDIVEHGLGYATRLRGWVGQSSDYELSRQIVAMIRDGGLPLSQRELCRRTHRKANDVKTAIELALSAGLLAPAKKGKATVWALA